MIHFVGWIVCQDHLTFCVHIEVQPPVSYILLVIYIKVIFHLSYPVRDNINFIIPTLFFVLFQYLNGLFEYFIPSNIIIVISLVSSVRSTPSTCRRWGMVALNTLRTCLLKQVIWFWIFFLQQNFKSDDIDLNKCTVQITSFTQHSMCSELLLDINKFRVILNILFYTALWRLNWLREAAKKFFFFCGPAT